MRFITMHKMTAEMEKGLPPDPSEMAAIGQMMEDAAKQNIMLSGEGLKPTAQRLYLRYKGGKRSVTEGPFIGATELIAGFALLRVSSKEEAVKWCDKYAAVHGDVDLYLGPVVEMWDLGFCPEPENAPRRFLITHQLDPRLDTDAPPDAKLTAKLDALVAEMQQAGVLEARGGFASTKRGARLRFEGGKRTVIDGPFAESKELIAGYAIFELPSKAAAIEWASRFGSIVKVNEIEIRELLD